MKIIQVIAHPGSSRNTIKEEINLLGETIYHIYTSSKPIDGEANKAVIEQLSEYFDCRKSSLQIIRGETSKHKFVKIEGFS